MPALETIVTFGAGEAARVADPELLGSKGAALATMAGLGLPVPPGFVVPVATANDPEARASALREGLRWLRSRMDAPIVSVRSGAAVSMPGMMDTVLNVGAPACGPEAGVFELDCRRRFLQAWGSQVEGLPRALFDEILDDETLTGTGRETLGAAVARFETLVGPLPNTLDAMVTRTATAVVASWQSERALAYREATGATGEGTAVIVQAMVFGNRDERSATGVVSTRDTRTGEPGLVGEYLPYAQGEDVVGGFAHPLPIDGGSDSFRARFPELRDELDDVAKTLERHARDAQEIEFTVDAGSLWLLQTRAAKRDADALLRMAVDMAEEGLIDRAEAVRRARPDLMMERLSARLVPGQSMRIIARGLAAASGAAAGRVVLDADAALGCDDPCVLVRSETDPNDFAGMNASVAVLTARGGIKSHAAGVASSIGLPCVTGATSLRIDAEGFDTPVARVEAGDWITVDGSTGSVYAGRLETERPVASGTLATLLEWQGAAA